MSENNEIKIAYLLLAHKNPEQVNLFVNQLLEYGDCDVYIHIDKKNQSMCDAIIKNEHVFVCSEYETKWASFDICKAAVKLMELVRDSGRSYTHFYFGSGQDLLVKSGLYEYLAEHSDRIFLRIIREVSKRDKASARYRIRWPRKLMISNNFHIYRFVRKGLQILCRMGIVIRRNNKTLKHEVKFYTGGTWFIAPIFILEYILNYLEQNPDYFEFWEESLASDLMFFQTIIMNSPYSELVENELMYIHWGDNHPLSVTIDDDAIIESGNYFCARKFEIDERDAIEYYLNKTKRGKEN